MGAADTLQAKLDTGELIVIDGGTGTEIPRHGVNLCPTTWSGRITLTHPDLIRQIHESYIHAGAEVIIANTFSTKRSSLILGGLDDKTKEINQLAVKLAMEARDNVTSDKPIAIAGSLATLTPMNDPSVSQPYDIALADYREQAQILAESGVDFFILEMIIRSGDAKAAVQAASETGLPIWVGYSLHRDEDRLYLGSEKSHNHEGIREAVDAVDSQNVAAFFIMHTKVEDTLEGLQKLRDCTSLPIGAYAHSIERRDGVPVTMDVGWSEHHTISEYLYHAQSWVDMGASVIGGCCGVTPDQIRAISSGIRVN